MKAFQQLTLDMLSYNQFKALRLNIAQVVGKENKIKAWGIADRRHRNIDPISRA